MKINTTGAHQLIGYILSLILRCINCTLRWEKTGLERDGKHWSTGEPVILVFWHGDQLLMPWSYLTSNNATAQRPIKALVSLHADGRIAVEALKHLSITCVNGSSSRGGSRALVQMKKFLKEGSHVGITPDGPKGPCHEAKIGAALLSSISGVPVLPIAIAAKRSWDLGSWDKMFIPKPFSPATMVAGDLISVPAGLSREELSEHSEVIGAVLNDLKSKAEHALLKTTARRGVCFKRV